MKNKLPALSAGILLIAGGFTAYRSYQEPVAGGGGEGRSSAASGLPVEATESRPAPAPTAGDQLIRDARTQLERRPSVTARVRQQASIGGRAIRGVGGYWQQGGGDELLVRLELQIVGEDSRLLQVCTGRFLWTDERFPTGRTIKRLDLRKLRNEALRTDDDFEGLDDSPASWPAIQPELSLRYGGLTSLLASISDSFAFSAPQSMRWTPNPRLDAMPESIPVFAVVGRWKPEALSAIAAKPHESESFSQRLPQEILVLFGQGDLFPYRIEFRNQLGATGSAGQPAAPPQLSGDPLMCIEFETVTFGASIAAGQFEYLPGDAKFDDKTAEYQEKLRLKQSERIAAQRRAQQ